jgi:MerR family transcriptional regulator, thiopeptide resistance regulator
MEYTVKQLADLAGISVRTLHYYDQIGLLRPHQVGENRYRYYGENELIRLQQILFFRELDFALDQIKKIIDKPDFNVLVALREHKIMLKKRIGRLNRLIETVDKTSLNLKGKIKMKEEEYYQGFSNEQQEKYEKEILGIYGNEAIDESKRRMKGWAKEDYRRVQEEGDLIFTAIRDNIDKGYDSAQVQIQIEVLKSWLNHFYTCTDEILLGLGRMYNEHPDFVKMWKTKYHKDMPSFLLKAIEEYCRKKKD